MESDPATDPAADPGADRPLERADVAKVAELALLELTDSDLDRFTVQLGVVLDRARELAAFDISDVPRTAHPYPLSNVFRPDEVVEMDAEQREQVLAAAPAEEHG
ncbi:MAG: Asp-tRNA(Asn)/Glu-tRNA(Gln) amidotransferase subunit GatC, partial [Actinomycetota bacterium]